MKGNRSTSVLVLILSTVLAGCSAETGTSDGKVASANTANANRQIASAETAPPLDAGPANANLQPGTINAAENPMMAAKREKIEAMRRSGSDPSATQANLETLLRQSTRPAPEDSEFAIALADVVTERRTFRKHPILKRIEKITDGQRSTIKVTTVDGRSLELPGAAIEKLSVASSESILKAAGIEAPRHTPSDRKAGAAESN